MERTATGEMQFSLIRMTWPVFIELLLQMLVGNIDQIMLSHYNETAVAAVGNANQIMNTLILTFTVISLAATILLSQYLGARQLGKVRQIYTLAAGLNLVLSLVITAGLLLGADGLFALMQVPPEAVPEARTYLLIAALSLPCQALMLTFSAFLRAHAHMLVIMCSTGIINLINIVGNTAFIYGLGPLPRMGAAGAALSTSLCRTAGMLMMLFAFFKSVEGATLSPKVLRPFPAAAQHWPARRGRGPFLQPLPEHQPRVCEHHRHLCGDRPDVHEHVRPGVLHAGERGEPGGGYHHRLLHRRIFAPVTVGIALLLAVFAKPLLSLFTTDPRVIELGCRTMWVEVVLEIGRAFNVVLVRNLQAVGDVKFPVALGILSQWIVGVGIAWLFGIYLGWGLVGIWMAFALDENLRAVLFIIRWKAGKWRNIKTV